MQALLREIDHYTDDVSNKRGLHSDDGDGIKDVTNWRIEQWFLYTPHVRFSFWHMFEVLCETTGGFSIDDGSNNENATN